MAESDRPLNLRSILTLLLIIFTIFTLLVYLGGSGFALTFARLGFAGLSFYFIFRYLRSMRGYQDRYEKVGKQAANQAQILRLVVLAIIFYVSFSILNQEIGNVAIAFLITAIIYGSFVQWIDERAGRDMVEYVAYKKKSHQDFVDSISDVSGKCLSCNKKIGEDEGYCPFCGFEQRKIKKDTSYIG